MVVDMRRKKEGGGKWCGAALNIFGRDTSKSKVTGKFQYTGATLLRSSAKLPGCIAIYMTCPVGGH